MTAMQEDIQSWKTLKAQSKNLLCSFKNSRDKWKEKCKQAMLDIRSLKKRIEFLEQSKAELKCQLKELKAQNQQLQNDMKKFDDIKKNR